MSWNVALGKGCEPNLYPYNPTDIPAGIYDARLDFKIWAKKTMAVVCYFTIIDTGKKCCLPVFRTKAEEQYKLTGNPIDFTTCPLEQLYRISINYNGKNKPVLKEAEML